MNVLGHNPVKLTRLTCFLQNPRKALVAKKQENTKKKELNHSPKSNHVRWW